MADTKVLRNMIKDRYPELSKTERNLVIKKLMKMNVSEQSGQGIISNVVKKVKKLVGRLVPKNGQQDLEPKNNEEPDPVEPQGPDKPDKPEKPGLAEKGLNVLGKVVDKVSGCKNKNPEWDYKPKPGEKHQVFLKDGCSFRGFFSGPGTRIIKGVKELLAKHNGNISMALQPKNFASKVDLYAALPHDIRYLLANREDKAKGEADVRKADLKFIRTLENLLKTGQEPKVNVWPPLQAMKAKVFGEKLKVVKVYGIGGENGTPEDFELCRKVLKHLEMKGYGKCSDEEIAVLDKDMDRELSEQTGGSNIRGFLETRGYAKPRPVRTRLPYQRQRCVRCDKVMTKNSLVKHLQYGVCTGGSRFGYDDDTWNAYLNSCQQSEIDVLQNTLPHIANSHILSFLNTHHKTRNGEFTKTLCSAIAKLRRNKKSRQQVSAFIQDYTNPEIIESFVNGSFRKQQRVEELLKNHGC